MTQIREQLRMQLQRHEKHGLGKGHRGDLVSEILNLRQSYLFGSDHEVDVIL